jgi:regulatory protein
MPNVITSITVQKKNRDRFNLFINEQYAFSLNRQQAEALHKGDHLSECKIAELKQADEKDFAYSRALYYLNFRPRSRMEIKRYLTEKKFPLPSIHSTLSRLENHGYINDHEFARLWIENRLRFRPKGIYALTAELREKGIGEHIIKNALKDFDELASAWAAVSSRIDRLQKLEKSEFTRKLYSFLSRRGFGYSICKEVCDQAWEKNSHTTEEKK